MHMSNVKFNDVRVNPQEWANLSSKEPYNSHGLPILKTPDGKIMRQSQAIWRKIARENNMYPTDPDVVITHDWVLDTY